MSEYSYRQRDARHAPDNTFSRHGRGGSPVYRPYDDSAEDIPRDFAPPRSRGFGRRYDDEDDHLLHRTRPSYYDSDEYWSDDYDSLHRPARRPVRNKRQKSGVGEVLDGIGLGGVAGALLGNKGHSQSRSNHDRDRRNRDNRRYSRSSSFSSSSSSRGRGNSHNKWQQAAKAAAAAAAVEAMRSRKQPGAWAGEKGTRVATAAFSAAGIDGLLNSRNPGHHSDRHVAEAAIGGVLSNRLANGIRRQSRARGRSTSMDSARSRSQSTREHFRSSSLGRSRGRSRGVGGIKELALGGSLAAAGKAMYDRVRSRGRSRANDDAPTRVQRYGRDNPDDPNFAQSHQDRQGGTIRSSSTSSESTTDMDMSAKGQRGKQILTAGLTAVATIHALHGVQKSVRSSQQRHTAVKGDAKSSKDAHKGHSKAMVRDFAAIGIAALGFKSVYSEWKKMKQQRTSMKELKTKRSERKKKREGRDHMLREMSNPHDPGGGWHGFAPAPAYNDANPYSAGAAPPMGGLPPEW